MGQELFPTILLVDVDPDNLADWGRVLREPGFRMITAGHGDSAFETARLECQNLMLCDVSMPDMNGFELCRLIKSEAELSDTPIIPCGTHFKDSEVAAEGLSAGAVAYLVTPTKPTVLTA